MLYFYLKALHIIGFVSWFAGLFYLVRLFIYHVEANDRAVEERKVLQEAFELMALRLYNIIMTPAMVVTLICGFGMIGYNPAVFQSWLHIKLTFVALLVVYHFYNRHILRKLQNKQATFSSYQFRLWNEIATLFLIAIVLIAVFKNTLNFITAFFILLGVMIALFLGVRIYRYVRGATNK